MIIFDIVTKKDHLRTTIEIVLDYSRTTIDNSS